MKTLPLLTLILLSGSLSLLAAEAKPGGNPARLADRLLPGIERLPEAEQKQVRAARDRALLTPEVQAAIVDRTDTGKDYANVQQTALLAADEKLSPILDKLKKKGRNIAQLGALATGRGGPRVENLLADLTPEERQQLGNAYAKTRNQPEVKAAQDRMLMANTALRKATEAAMLKADPTVQPLLAKLGPPPRAMRAQRPARAQ